MYDSASTQAVPKGRTEWDVLKENHRFIREDEDAADVSWEERLARAYESKLFKEYALVDLKHYKSAKIALRWRTAPEVVNGIGETTCASLRCPYNRPASASSSPSRRSREGEGRRGKMPTLIAYELPFVYQEGGERKEALVKVKVCKKCSKKLLWGHGDKEEDVQEEREEDHRKRRRASPETHDREEERRQRRDR